MTIDNGANDESLEHALIKCLRLFAKHGRKIRHESLSNTKVRLDRNQTEKETNDSSNFETVQVHNTTDIKN